MLKDWKLVISNWEFKKWLFLITILIIASFLRLYNFIPLEIRPAEGTAAAAMGGLSLTGLTSLPPGLYPDEAMNGNNAVEAWENRGWKVFYPENFGREGLFINIQSLFVAALGNEAWVLRLPSAIFGILTILGLYFFTAELFKNKNLALLSAFLLATSFWHINFSRIGFRAIMAPAFLVWSLYLLLKSVDQTKNNFQLPISNYQFWKLGIRNWILPAVAGLIYGLGFHSYIAYRATPILILPIGYFLYKNHSNVLKNVRMIFLLFAISTIIAVLPLAIYFLKNPADFFGRTTGISIFSSETPLRDLGLNILKTAGMFNIVGDFNWRHNVASRPLLFWPIGLMFLMGLFVAIKNLIQNLKINWKLGIPLVWLAIAALPVVVSNEGLPHALRSLLMAPPVFILAAVGGMKVYEILKLKLKSRWLLVVSCWLLLSLLLFESYVTYFVTWGENPNVKNAFAYNDSIIAKYLNSLPRELPKYVVVSDARGPIERDNPISLQAILFLTDTFTDEKRKEKNIFYVAPKDIKNISKNSFVISL